MEFRISWKDLPAACSVVVGGAEFAALEVFRDLARQHMLQIFGIKRKRAELWDNVIKEGTNGYLILSTMDYFVKWRAGAIK
eukprot:2928455-Pyramimonas_sp.AAC.1